jgi:hypothetical protein
MRLVCCGVAENCGRGVDRPLEEELWPPLGSGASGKDSEVIEDMVPAVRTTDTLSCVWAEAVVNATIKLSRILFMDCSALVSYLLKLLNWKGADQMREAELLEVTTTIIWRLRRMDNLDRLSQRCLMMRQEPLCPVT